VNLGCSSPKSAASNYLPLLVMWKNLDRESGKILPQKRKAWSSSQVYY